MKKNSINYNVEDIAIFIMIVAILAFRDYQSFCNISSLIAFLIITINILKNRKINKKVIPYITNKIVFIVFCCISVVWALNKQLIPYIFVRLIHRFMIGFSIIVYTNNLKQFKKIIKYMIIACIILCFRMLINVPIGAWGVERVGKYLAHDPDNTYGNTGITYALGIVGVYLLTSGDKIIKNKKLKYLIVAIFSLFSLLSGSKKQVLFLLISIPMMFFLKSTSKKDFIKNFFISIGIVIIIIILIMKVDMFYNAIGVRILSTLSYFFNNISVNVDAPTLSRINFIKDSWNVFLNNPILGVGIAGYQYVNSYEFVWAENTFLELLADVGIIGMVIYYYLHFFILVSFCRRLKYKNIYDIQLCIVFVCLIVIDLSMVSYYNETLQLYLALIYAQNNIAKEISDEKK